MQWWCGLPGLAREQQQQQAGLVGGSVPQGGPLPPSQQAGSGGGFVPAASGRLAEPGSGGSFVPGDAGLPLPPQQQQRQMGRGGGGPQGSTMPLPVQLQQQARIGRGSVPAALGGRGVQDCAQPPLPEAPLERQQQQGYQQALAGSGQCDAHRMDVDCFGAPGQPIAGGRGGNAYQALLSGVPPTPEGRASGGAAAALAPPPPVQAAAAALVPPPPVQGAATALAPPLPVQGAAAALAPPPPVQAAAATLAPPLPAQVAAGNGSQNASVGDQQPAASGAGAEQERQQPSGSSSGAVPSASSGAHGLANFSAYLLWEPTTTASSWAMPCLFALCMPSIVK